MSYTDILDPRNYLYNPMMSMAMLYGTNQGFRNYIAYVASDYPVIGPYFRLRDNLNYITDYMRNTGLSWSDAKYPTRVTGSGGAYALLRSGYGALNFVSNNLEKMYR